MAQASTARPRQACGSVTRAGGGRGLKLLCSVPAPSPHTYTRESAEASDLEGKVLDPECAGVCWSDQECAGMRMRIFSPILQVVEVRVTV